MSRLAHAAASALRPGRKRTRGRGQRLPPVGAALLLFAAMAAIATTGCSAFDRAAMAGSPHDATEADAITADQIVVADVESSWDHIGALFLGSGAAAPFSPEAMYVLRGTIENRSSRPVHHVVLRYELLDEAGEVLDYQEGYNRRAEIFGDGSGRDDTIEAIPAGATDTFRMVFFGDEVPRFANRRVRVIQAVPGP